MRWFLSGKPGTASLRLDRLKGLSDGVIAVAMTLLVLGIEVPKDHDFSQEGILSFVSKFEYQLTVYSVSFVLIGTYWIVQSVMFHYFRQGSRTLTWLNLLFLFVLTLLPFMTNLIGTYRNEPNVMVIYGTVNIACSLSLAMMWWYSNHVAPVVWPKIDPSIARSMTLRILMGAVVSLIAIVVSFVNVRLSHIVFLTMPLLYVSHRSVDTHWPEVVDKDEAGTGDTS